VRRHRCLSLLPVLQQQQQQGPVLLLQVLRLDRQVCEADYLRLADSRRYMGVSIGCTHITSMPQASSSLLMWGPHLYR
jgi:hypothetical protein